jgi:DNA-nicking Smr family endonuclease
VRHRAVLPPLAIGEPPPGLDAARWSRLRAGRLVPERRLDLHGLTAAQAHVALRAFLFAAAEAEVRCVAVITGRGSGEAGGVLKRELPLWLNDATLRPLLLAAAYACAANPGAVLLLLRRRR